MRVIRHSRLTVLIESEDIGLSTHAPKSMSFVLVLFEACHHERAHRVRARCIVVFEFDRCLFAYGRGNLDASPAFHSNHSTRAMVGRQTGKAPKVDHLIICDSDQV